jgi:alkylation response protein AidB-like acyl-CoA dehydrogenase
MAQGVASDLESVLAAVREVVKDRIAPDAAGVDRERRFPQAGLDALAEVGALGLLIKQAAPEPCGSRRTRLRCRSSVTCGMRGRVR